MRFRMLGHVLKCVKNYTGEKLQCCVFNPSHMIPITEDLNEHYKSCPDYTANYLPELDETEQKKKLENEAEDHRKTKNISNL